MTWLKHLQGVRSREHISHRSLPCEVVKGARLFVDAVQIFVCEQFIMPCASQMSTRSWRHLSQRMTFWQTCDIFMFSTVEDKSINLVDLLCCCCWCDPVIVCPRYRVVGISIHRCISRTCVITIQKCDYMYLLKMKNPAWQLWERLPIMVFVAVTATRLKCIFNNLILTG